jgi:hypothetical protein
MSWSHQFRRLQFVRVSSLSLNLLLLTLVSASAAQITWTNPAGGTWNSALNWSPNQVPGAADTAIITNNSMTVSLDVSPTVGGITLGLNGGCAAGGTILALNGQTLTLNGALMVNACGQFTVDSGVLAGTSNAILNGTIGWSGGSLAGILTLSSQSVLNVSGSNDHNMPGCTLTNLGTVAWSGGRIRGGGNTATILYNLGLWDAQSDQVLNNDYGGNGTVFNNLGTFRKSGGAGQSTSTVLTGGVLFNQLAGVIDVQNGTNGLVLAFQGGGNFTGGYTTTNTLGLTVLSSGNFTINGTVTSSNVLENEGNLVGTNVIQGALQWQAGNWNGAPSVTVAANSTLYVNTTADHDLPNCTLTNNGTVAWSNGRIRGGGSPGTIVYNHGLWDSQADLTLNADFGGNGAVFNNFGAFRKSGGISESTSTVFGGGVLFNQQAGVIDVQNGTDGLALVFQGGGNFTGGYITTNSFGLTVLSAGNFTINGTVTGANTTQNAGNLVGTNVIRGGLTWVAGSWNNAGPITITTNSTVNIISGNDHDLANCIVTNLGTVAWADGRVRGGGNSQTLLHNFGLWDAQNDQVLNNDYGGSGTIFANAGVFRKSGGTGTNATAILGGVTFNNTGTLDVQTNLLSFQGGGNFTGGAVTGSGLIQLAVGTFTINGTRTTANVQLVGGSLAGINVLTGEFTWVVGSWNNAGPITIPANSTVHIVSGQDHDMANCVVTNLGTVAWADGRIRGGGNNPTLVHNFGLWDAQNDQVINNDYGGAGTIFTNAGTFRKSGGTGDTSLLGGVTFNNTGTVDVPANVLSLQGGGSFTGGFVTGAGLVQLGGPAYTINGTRTTTNVQLVGGSLAGVNVFTGGFTWVSGNWNNSGPITISTNTTLDIVTGNDHDMANCVVTNLGTVAWEDGRIRGGGNGQTSINNFGLWDAQNDQVINNDYGGSGTSLVNTGTLRKSGGTGATSLLGGVSFTNQNGGIEVDTGQLNVGSNSYGQGSGLFSVKLGGLAAGQFGQLITSSSASLSGPFSASLANGFAPALGNVFQVLSSASRSGTFASFRVPTGISVTYSNNGVFLVVTGPVTPLQITQQPTNQTVALGETATFTVTATGSAPLSYQWQANGTNLTDGSNIFGSTSNDLTISNVSAANPGTYLVNITDATGSSVTSSNATLSLLNCSPPPSGLVSWWPGDGNALDIVGGNNGTAQGGVTFMTGKVGPAFSFDGVTASVVVPDSSSLDVTTQFTLDAWINPASLQSDVAQWGIISKVGGPGGNNGYQFGITGNNGQIYCQFNAPGESWPANQLLVTLPTPIPTNAWTHVAGTYDNASLKIYFNGVVVGSLSVGAKSVVNSSSNLRISGDDNSNVHFHGLIDEPQVFNRALSDAEVLAIFNAGSAGQCKPTTCALVCPPNMVVTNSAGQCGALVNYTAPTTSGNCDPVSCTPANGSFFGVGATTVTCTTTNGGNCSFTVTVLDKESPSITCPTNLVLSTSPGLCGRTNVTYAVTLADNCPGATLIQTLGLASGATFPKGTTTNSFVATDASGNTATCGFTVTINDTEIPTLTCPGNILADAPSGQTTLAVTFAAPTATDNCPGVTASCAPPSGSAFSVGTTPVLCTAADTAGNTTTCTFNVTVNSASTSASPAITCPTNITTNNAPGQCGRMIAFVPMVTGSPAPTVTCKVGATVITSPNLFPVGTTAVSCTASNAAGTANCSFTVTVQDTEAPQITCPGPLTVQCDADVPAFNLALVKATDNCDPAPVVAFVSDVSTGTCPKIITRTYKATDAVGNSATCTQTITVHDTIAPVISGCSNLTVAAQSGQLGTSMNFAVTASDNCDGTVPVNCTPAPGYFALGQTPVTCTAVDHCGNLSSCTFTVTVTATTDSLRLCTFTQGFYGNANGKFNGNTSFTLVGQLLEQGPLVVGKIGSRSLSILPDETALLQLRLPSGGPPAALPNNGDQTLKTATGLPLNPKGRFTDVLLGQAITLSLNVRLSAPLLNFPLTSSFCTQGILAGADGLKGTADDVLVGGDIQMFNIPASVLTALSSSALGINDNTVKGLLELANRGLAGLPTDGASLSDINEAVDAVNRGFDECRELTNCSTSTVIADSFNDTFKSRPTLGLKSPTALALQALEDPKPASPPTAPMNIRVRSSNLNATKEPGEPTVAGNPGGKSVWWQWQAARSGPVTIETVGSSFDTLLGVYTGTTLSNLVLVASNDDVSSTVLTSQVSFPAQAGMTYQIVVDGVDGASGEIVLTLIADPPQLCLPVTLASDQMQFCIDGDLGRVYTFEASPDLLHWTLLATALNSDGTLRITDPAKSSSPVRFYRVNFEP